MSYTLGVIIIGIGILFDLGGCIGLIRMPDVYNRLQAATKCVTLGTCSILLGIFVIEGVNPSGLKALLAMFFVALTSPTGAHALARASYRYGVKLWEKSVKDKYSQVCSHPSRPEEEEK